MGALRRYLLTTVSAVAFAAAANAADLRPAPVAMPVKSPAPPAVAWGWAGFYIGLNAGVAWNSARFTDLGDPTQGGWAFTPGTTFWSPNKAGFTGGVQVGFNLQAGNFVYGLEGDLNWVDGRATTTLSGFGQVTATTKLEWMATARARAGLLVAPSTLIYATGGAAFAHFKDNWGYTNAPSAFSSSETRVGWTAGGGIEHMFARNWTVKIEALYADFGNWTVFGSSSAFASSYSSRFAHEIVAVRGGLNWKW